MFSNRGAVSYVVVNICSVTKLRDALIFITLDQNRKVNSYV